MTCATLNSAADDDKAYASTFLLGYRSALTHSHTIEVKRIEAVEEAALADCATKPEAMATKVFAAALAKIAAGAANPLETPGTISKATRCGTRWPAGVCHRAGSCVSPARRAAR